MTFLRSQLDLERCPHCNVDRPMLTVTQSTESNSVTGQTKRFWRTYLCSRCGGMVTAAARDGWDRQVTEFFPKPTQVDESVPSKARDYLQQALNSLHAPAGAVMLAASAVDAMLKAKAYKDGSLYSRIDKAAGDHVITADMAKWAHEVRLDANDQRHADDSAPLPSVDDARRCTDFALALAQFMFVLPARVQRGISEAGSTK